jgi:uncharacterized membrane protein YdjX (TVP38/TMEM64 family)
MDLSKEIALTEDLTREEDDFSLGKLCIKAGLLMAFLVGGLILIFFSPLRAYLGQYREITVRLGEMGGFAPLYFICGAAVLVFIGVPRLLLCPIGGMAFGFLPGLLWAQIGTMLGFYAAFLFIRWGGRELVVRYMPKLDRLSRRFERGGLPAVILIRQLPVNGFFTNLLLGLMPISHVHFLLGTAIGLLPEAIPCTLIGSGAAQLSFGRGVSYMSIAMVMLLVFWIVCGFYIKTARGRKRVPDIFHTTGQENTTDENIAP